MFGIDIGFYAAHKSFGDSEVNTMFTIGAHERVSKHGDNEYRCDDCNHTWPEYVASPETCTRQNNEKFIKPRQVSQIKAPIERALDTQVSGNHYKYLPIQPIEYIHKNKIPFIEGSVIKYVTRWRAKGGVDDLKKAKHFLELLLELETSSK